ncbi:MAG: hypothetical protein IKE60_01310 [Reyranella sp.]|uniref:hypothetical protein n=1 Tax=Reyranella sp. TaxID=1929291 RepID=UPI0025E16D8F|nr:hypothetical protein [Reyranella sp.]MBR2813258.1 hypothetical protein [Reyranella sp.]
MEFPALDMASKRSSFDAPVTLNIGTAAEPLSMPSLTKVSMTPLLTLKVYAGAKVSKKKEPTWVSLEKVIVLTVPVDEKAAIEPAPGTIPRSQLVVVWKSLVVPTQISICAAADSGNRVVVPSRQAVSQPRRGRFLLSDTMAAAGAPLRHATMLRALRVILTPRIPPLPKTHHRFWGVLITSTAKSLAQCN